MNPRRKRGEKHPTDAGLFFFRYNRGIETWITESELKRRVDEAIARDILWKKTTVGRACAKRGWTAANSRNKEKMADYWKRPEVRQRLRDKWNTSPEIIARREARLKQKQERVAYRASDEFKAIQKERNKQQWLKRKESGKAREYERKKWHTNIQHRLGQNMRRSVHQALTRTQGLRKADKTFELIGCSARALSVHLEAQFTPEMSWENYGTYWEVDHALPLKMFDLRDPVQQRQAFYFENLQPLKVEDNRKKSDKVEGVSVRKIIPFKAA